MKRRTTNDEITELQPNEVFVFGSNLSGIHGGGAARFAFDKLGAEWGNPIGIQGSTYAIPTKSENIARTLTVDEIRPHVNEFISYAKLRPDLIFFVTEIGMGLAGHILEDIAPLFLLAQDIENIFMPQKFWNFFENLQV